MNTQEDQIIGELVAHDYRTAAVFKKYGIDFCCQGNRTIRDACVEKKIDEVQVVSDLQALPPGKSVATDFAAWPLDLLADHIEQKHHRYVEHATLELQPYLAKICRVHGGRHPELGEIQDHFNATAGELAVHMKKEELMLFPYIRRMVKAQRAGTPLGAAPFGSVQNPIQMMMADHQIEGDRFKKIERLSDGYAPPSDACNTYLVTFALLKEFEQDLPFSHSPRKQYSVPAGH